MEFEVKLVSAIEDCYVSLPLPLIQTLHSSSPSLPPVLALDLRSSSNDDRWTVAWSGATSSSPAIEVSSLFHFSSQPKQEIEISGLRIYDSDYR